MYKVRGGTGKASRTSLWVACNFCKRLRPSKGYRHSGMTRNEWVTVFFWGPQSSLMFKEKKQFVRWLLHLYLVSEQVLLQSWELWEITGTLPKSPDGGLTRTDVEAFGRGVWSLHSSSLGTATDRIIGEVSSPRQGCAEPSGVKVVSASILAKSSLPIRGTRSTGKYRNSWTTWWPPNCHRRGWQNSLQLWYHTGSSNNGDFLSWEGSYLLSNYRVLCRCINHKVPSLAPDFHFDHWLMGAQLEKAQSVLVRVNCCQSEEVCLRRLWPIVAGWFGWPCQLLLAFTLSLLTHAELDPRQRGLSNFKSF